MITTLDTLEGGLQSAPGGMSSPVLAKAGIAGQVYPILTCSLDYLITCSLFHWLGGMGYLLPMFLYLVPVEKYSFCHSRVSLSFPRRACPRPDRGRESRQVIVISWIPAFTGMIILDEILQIRYFFNRP